MPQQKQKSTFTNDARKQGNSMVVTIPAKIVQERNIQEGDTIAFETEHSEKIANREDREHGYYWSCWNETTQSGERK